MVEIPSDLDAVLDRGWQRASKVPGFLVEDEARFLGMAAACISCDGAIVEIGSFKGKSTVMLSTVAGHYGHGAVVAIDPHNFNSAELKKHRTGPGATSFEEFKRNLEAAGVSNRVEVHRAYASDVAAEWSRPIRFLWIDGDHSYKGAKADFDGFIRHVVPGGILAFHDALHPFSGPIRVFVEDVLRSDQFGAAGFVKSIAWAQFRPQDGALFHGKRAALERLAQRVLPFVKDDGAVHGLEKLLYKLNRSGVPRATVQPAAWAALLGGS